MEQPLMRGISLYQAYLSPILKQILGVQTFCRFSPSCAEYAKLSVANFGVLRGCWRAVIQLSQCHPFGRLEKLHV